jgi:hypothetical protein
MSGRDALPISGSIDDRLYGSSSRVGQRVTEGSQQQCCDVPPEGCSQCGFVPEAPAVEQDPVARLTEENMRLRTVMWAAALEIEEFWEAHCDSVGAGPISLMRHLRNGTGFYPQYVERLKNESGT